MNIGSFLKLVEIQTKVASVIPFLLGTSYVIYAFDEFKPVNLIIMFTSMIIFDMTATAINNYMDYKKAVKKEGYGYESHNAIVRDKINPKQVKFTILAMLIIAIVLGIILFLNTDIVVLVLGGICFAIGILYSYGPVPISRTPFGEIFSGLTMGFLITFIAIYIHIFDSNIITLGFSMKNFTIGFDLQQLIYIFIISMPLIVGISNIMLANNICDIEEDIVNKRYTLPIYIGKQRALRLFRWLYYIGFLFIMLGVVLKILPVISIVSIITYKIIEGNVKEFIKAQRKEDTFILAVKNFLIMNVVYILTIVVGMFI